MNPHPILRTLKIIHAALVFGLVIFTVIAYSITLEDHVTEVPNFENDPFVIVVPIMMVFGLFMSNFMAKMLISKVSKTATLQSKLSSYLTASIVKFALIEGPTLFAVVAFLLSGNLFYLIFIGVGVLALLWAKPKPERIAKTLDLNYEERDELGLKS